MDHEMLDTLLLLWREKYDELQDIEEEAAPIKQEMKDLEAQIKPIGIQLATSYKEVPTVDMNYRKGSIRVKYDTKVVDVVLAMLQDVSPNLAIQLESARIVTRVAPSVFVKAKD